VKPILRDGKFTLDLSRLVNQRLGTRRLRQFSALRGKLTKHIVNPR